MKIRLNKRQERMLSTLVFLIKLLLFTIPLYLIMAFSQVLIPLQRLVISHVRFLLVSLGFRITIDNLMVSITGPVSFAFFISEDCTGWKSMLLLVALIFAFPRVSMGKRLAGLAFGIPLIYLGNLARIIVVVLVQQSLGVGAAMVIHDYLWQAGLIALVLLTWLLWLSWTNKIKPFKTNHK